MSLADAKAGLKTALEGIFTDLGESKTAADKAQEVTDAFHDYVTQAVVDVKIPPTTVSQGTSPAVAPNVAEIPLSGVLT